MADLSPGGHWVICDRTGRKIMNHDAVREWNGSVVAQEEYEPRHPLDFAAKPRGPKALENARPRPTDTFLAYGDVTAEDL